MGCAGHIKAVKLDRKGMLLLDKHLLHIKKKKTIRPTAVSLTDSKIRKKLCYVSFKEDTLKKMKAPNLYSRCIFSYLF